MGDHACMHVYPAPYLMIYFFYFLLSINFKYISNIATRIRFYLVIWSVTWSLFNFPVVFTPIYYTILFYHDPHEGHFT
jgi:hypothetical protein